MPRIPYPDPDSLPDNDREFLQDLLKLNIYRLLAGCPSMFQPLVRLFKMQSKPGACSELLFYPIIYKSILGFVMRRSEG